MSSPLSRIAGIDHGEARIGLAISDPKQMIATPLFSVKPAKNLQETCTILLARLNAYEPIDMIILGFPLLMNGKEGDECKKVRKLQEVLEENGKKTLLWDERLTTAQAERTLKEAQMSRKKRTQYIDAMAAAAILQSYLDSPCNKSPYLVS